MTKIIFITATNTNVGKTFATTLLLENFAKRGYKVGAFKPIETGVLSIPEDASKLLKKCKELNRDFSDITIKDIAPITFRLPAAPFVANNNQKIDFSKLSKSLSKISKVCDIVLIEGAGGLMVPIVNDFFMVDLIKFFNASACLITPQNLGCINDTLLSTNLLKEKNIPFIWCINDKNSLKDFKLVTLPYYKYKFKNIIFLQRNIETIMNKLLII